MPLLYRINVEYASSKSGNCIQQYLLKIYRREKRRIEYILRICPVYDDLPSSTTVFK